MSKLRLKEEATTVPTPPSGYVTFYAKTDGKLYFKDDTGTEYPVKPVGGGTGDLLSDGSVPLTANWDVGSFKLIAQQFESDVPTGTAPLVVASTTLVANLNADLLDGNEAAAFLLLAATSLSGAGFFLDEDSFASDDDTKVASQQSIKAYVAAQITAAITGLWDDKGNYDASTNTPDLDVSPSGSIQKGDVYTVSVAGDFFTEAVEPGDTLRALQDAPTTLAHWARGQTNLINAIVDADFSGGEGLMRKTGAGAYEVIKTNLSAADDPDANDDSASGYAVGSIWINTTEDTFWVCVDASVGAAIWSSGGGGGLLPVFVTNAESPYSANAGELVICDSSGGAITVTLPAAPDDLDRISIYGGASANTYNVTVGRNGNEIIGAAEDFVIDQAWGEVDLAFNNGDSDWQGAVRGHGDLVTAYPGSNLQTGTSYELVYGDRGRIVEMNNASPNTLNIPANSAVAFPVNTFIDVVQGGAGSTTITITTDTLNGTAAIATQYGRVRLWKRDTTEWTILRSP